MTSIHSGKAEQYGDSHRLAARARLHAKYTVAETGWFPWVAQHLPIDAGDKVLDIGCGPGWFWASAIDGLPPDLDLTLCDLSAGMVQEATDRCRTVPFGHLAGCRADATNLPFETGCFDGVVAMHMLYHVPDPHAAIAEACRVLTPGGWFAITTNGEDNLRELYALTAAFGGTPVDPAAVAFGTDAAARALRSRFGNVSTTEHPAHLRITDPEDVVQALTSYPPGDRASEAQLSAFRAAVSSAFRENGGTLVVRKQSALLISRKDSD